VKRWEESISIKASADGVFAYVSDFARHGEWSGHGLQVSMFKISKDLPKGLRGDLSTIKATVEASPN